jgi:flagellar hook-length control protein FliK
MHSIGEGQQTPADMAVSAAPAGEHLAMSVLRETGNGPINLRAAPISAASNAAQRVDSSPEMWNFDPGGRGADARSAGRGTGTTVQSQPAPLAESVEVAQPEVEGLVREKFPALDRMVTGQTSLAGQDAGHGPVGRIGRSAPVARSAGTPAPLVEQVVKVVRVLTNEQRSEMRVRMWPPNLGELNVRLVHEGDSLRVQLAAETGAARDLLEARLPQLRHALMEIGGGKNDVRVTVTAAEQPAFAAFTANHDAGQTPYQQGGRPHGSPPETQQHVERPEESAGDGSGLQPAVTAGHIDVHA